MISYHQMFWPKLGAQTVSRETALPCLEHLWALKGDTTVRFDAAIDENVVSLGRLIIAARKNGIPLRWTRLDWVRLLIAISGNPVLLVLKNGNAVVALRNGHNDVEDIVASDPLHQSGEPFFLPRTVLERAWGGEALTLKPHKRKIERAVRWIIGILSICGIITGGYFLLQAYHDLVGR